MWSYLKRLDKKTEGYIEDVGITGISVIIAGITSYGYRIALARGLTESQFGLASTVLAAFTVFGLFHHIIGVATTRLLSEDHSKARSVIISGTLLGLSGGILVLLSAPVFSKFLNIPVEYLALVVVSMISGSLCSDSLNQTKGRFNLIAIVRSFKEGFVFLYGIITLFLFGNIFIVLLAKPIAETMATLVYAWFGRKSLLEGKFNLEESFTFAKELPSSSLKFAIGGIPASLDMLLVSHYLPEATGIFGGLVTFGKAYVLFLSAISFVHFTDSSGRHDRNSFKYSLIIGSVIFCGGTMIGILAPAFWVNLLLGAKYIEAAHLFAPYLISMLFFAISAIFLNEFVAKGQTKNAVFLVALYLLQVPFIHIFHSSLIEVIYILMVVYGLSLISGVFLAIRSGKYILK